MFCTPLSQQQQGILDHLKYRDMYPIMRQHYGNQYVPIDKSAYHYDLDEKQHQFVTAFYVFLVLAMTVVLLMTVYIWDEPRGKKADGKESPTEIPSPRTPGRKKSVVGKVRTRASVDQGIRKRTKAIRVVRHQRRMLPFIGRRGTVDGLKPRTDTVITLPQDHSGSPREVDKAFVVENHPDPEAIVKTEENRSTESLDNDSTPVSVVDGKGNLKKVIEMSDALQDEEEIRAISEAAKGNSSVLETVEKSSSSPDLRVSDEQVPETPLQDEEFSNNAEKRPESQGANTEEARGEPALTDADVARMYDYYYETGSLDFDDDGPKTSNSLAQELEGLIGTDSDLSESEVQEHINMSQEQSSTAVLLDDPEPVSPLQLDEKLKLNLSSEPIGSTALPSADTILENTTAVEVFSDNRQQISDTEAELSTATIVNGDTGFLSTTTADTDEKPVPEPPTTSQEMFMGDDNVDENISPSNPRLIQDSEGSEKKPLTVIARQDNSEQKVEVEDLPHRDSEPEETVGVEASSEDTITEKPTVFASKKPEGLSIIIPEPSHQKAPATAPVAGSQGLQGISTRIFEAVRNLGSPMTPKTRNASRAPQQAQEPDSSSIMPDDEVKRPKSAGDSPLSYRINSWAFRMSQKTTGSRPPSSGEARGARAEDVWERENRRPSTLESVQEDVSEQPITLTETPQVLLYTPSISPKTVVKPRTPRKSRQQIYRGFRQPPPFWDPKWDPEPVSTKVSSDRRQTIGEERPETRREETGRRLSYSGPRTVNSEAARFFNGIS